jgi:hypothetical protein
MLNKSKMIRIHVEYTYQMKSPIFLEWQKYIILL